MSQGLCPNCGAAVSLTAGQTETKCEYCANDVSVQQAEGLYAARKNSKLGGALILAENARLSGNYDAAENYYNKIIEEQPGFAEASLYKGICISRNRESGDNKFFYNFATESLRNEAINSWKMAIKFAEHPEHMRKRVATEVSTMMADCLSELRKEGHCDALCLESEPVLAFALECDPTSIAIAHNGIALCDLPNLWNSQGGHLVANAAHPKLREVSTRMHQAKRKYEEARRRINPDSRFSAEQAFESQSSGADRGRIYQGRVTAIEKFGVIVEFGAGHLSVCAMCPWSHRNITRTGRPNQYSVFRLGFYSRGHCLRAVWR